MKKILFTLLIAINSVSIQAVEISRTQAITILKEAFKGQDVDYYIYKTSMRDDMWDFFVDMEPQKGWSHKCCRVTIPKIFRSIDKPAITYLTMPPINTLLIPIDVKNRYGANAGLKLRVPKATNSNTSTEAASHTYALILSGGWNKYSNYNRYWNDCSFIYQSLRNKYDIPKDNIYVAMADGTDPAEDMLDLATMEYVSSPLDLDFDGQADIRYAATKENVSNILSELQGKLTEEDNLFIYVIDHGGSTDNAGSSYICLWNGGTLHDTELATMLEPFNAGTINVLLGQCFSGGFIEELKGNNRVIATACSGSEYSWACSDIPYDEFVYHWTCAINEMDKDMVSIKTDVDKNGHVSMLEAFQYAEKNDSREETPQYSSLTPSVGEDLAFNNMPQAVDLYMRDDYDDTGKEPYKGKNASIYSAYNSPDIYLRCQEDGFECEENETPNIAGRKQPLPVYIYVKIWNRGTKPYNTKDKYLHVFWTNANTAYIAPSEFWGKPAFPGNKGEHIGGFRIDENIAPGEFAKKEIWSIIQPSWYKNASANGDLGIALLGVITDSEDLDTIPSNIVGHYVKARVEDNDIAMKNEQVIMFDDRAVLPDSIPLYFVGSEMKFDVIFLSDLMPMTFVGILDRPLCSGTTVSGVNHSPISPASGYQIPLANNSQIRNISLKNGEVGTMKLAFERNANATDEDIDGKSFAILQKDSETGEIVGSITYRFMKKKNAATTSTVTSPQISNIGLDANNTQMYLNFSEPVEASSLHISTSYPQVNTMEKTLDDGTTQTTVDIPQNYNGMLIVNLVKNGKIIDTKKIIK